MKKVLKTKALLFTLMLTLISIQCIFPLGMGGVYADPENGGSIEVMDKSFDGVSATVLESDSNHTVVRFDIGKFSKNAVDIDGSEYYKIYCNGTSLDDELGAPELPRICRSIVLPNEANMKIKVLSADYTDYKNTPVAPSKGAITRDMNPEDIPYTFGEPYQTGEWYPSNLAELSEPFIMRELSGATIKLNAFQYQASAETLRVYDSVTVEVVAEAESDINAPEHFSHSPQITGDFEAAYENVFINYGSMDKMLASAAPENGDMLIIAYDQFGSAMDPFVQWKNSKGIDTTLVNISSVSQTNNPAEIKSYIQNCYNQNPSLAYVLLVGDYAQVSSPTYSGGVSDPEYTKVAGNDNYPDIFVGRFSAESISDVQTQVQRTLEFEQNNYNAASWYYNGIGIASAEGYNPSDSEHMDAIRSKLLASGYSSIDRIYDPGASASSVTTSLNQGRGIINYCGHGASTYWVTTGFSNNDITVLQNQGELPFIISVSCVSGQFHTGTCFAEAWLRSKNSSGNPIGAIATYMSTVNQPWTPPMVGQNGIVDLICSKGKISFGGLCYTGATKMLDSGTSSDILTFNTWTVFGDPSIQVINTGSNPPTQDKNVALNKTATASTTYSKYSPSNAVDGNMGTYWSATSKSSGWLAIDLGANYTISSVKVNWSNKNYSTQYRVQNWDGVNWVTQQTVQGDGSLDEITFENPIETSQIRIYCDTPNSRYYSINECEVYGH